LKKSVTSIHISIKHFEANTSIKKWLHKSHKEEEKEVKGIEREIR